MKLSHILKRQKKRIVIFAFFAAAIMLLPIASAFVNPTEIWVNMNDLPYEKSWGILDAGPVNLRFNGISDVILLKITLANAIDSIGTDFGSYGIIESLNTIFIIKLSPGDNNETLHFYASPRMTLKIDKIRKGNHIEGFDDCTVNGFTYPGKWDLTQNEKYIDTHEKYEATLTIPDESIPHALTIYSSDKLSFFTITNDSISRFDVINDNATPYEPAFPLLLPEGTTQVTLRSNESVPFKLIISSDVSTVSVEPSDLNLNWLGLTNWRLTEDPAVSTQPEVVVDINNKVHVAWVDDRDGETRIFHQMKRGSTDTWSVAEALTDDRCNIENMTFGGDKSGDSLAIVWEERPVSFPFLYVLYSNDGGVNWYGPSQIAMASDPDIEVRGNEIYLVYKHWGPIGPDFYISMRLIWSTSGMTQNNTHTFENPVTGDEFSGVPAVAVDGDTIHVVIADRDWHNMYYWVSNDLGVTWSPYETITQFSGIVDPDKLDMVADNDKVFIVWSDNRDGQYEIYYKVKKSQGWSEDIRVTNTTEDSIQPEIAIAPPDHGYVVDELVYGPSSGDGTEYGPFYLDAGNIINCTLYIDEGSGEVYPIEEDVDYTLDYSIGMISLFEENLPLEEGLSFIAYYNYSISTPTRLHLVWQECNNTESTVNVHYRGLDEEGSVLVTKTGITDALNNSYLPDITLDGFGGMHYVWVDERDGNPEIYYSGHGYPKLIVSDLRIFPEVPSPGDPVTIFVTVSNEGDVPAYNVPLYFQAMSAPQIFTSVIISELPANSDEDLEDTWTPTQGPHTIVVAVDQNDIYADGTIVEIESSIYVSEPPVADFIMYNNIQLTMKVTGTPGPTVTAELYDDSDLLIETITITRGNKEKEKTITFKKRVDREYGLLVNYESNGVPEGDTPVKFTLESETDSEIIHLVFNASESEQQEIELEGTMANILSGYNKIIVDSGRSHDPDGNIQNVVWSVDELSSLEELTPFIFSHNGTFNVTLEVVDEYGLSSNITHSVTMPLYPGVLEFEAINDDWVHMDSRLYTTEGHVIYTFGVLGNSGQNQLFVTDAESESAVNDILVWEQEETSIVPALLYHYRSRFIYLIWTGNQDQNKELYYCYSNDLGSTWSEANQIYLLPEALANSIEWNWTVTHNDQIWFENIDVEIKPFEDVYSISVTAGPSTWSTTMTPDVDMDYFIDWEDPSPEEFNIDDDTTYIGDETYTSIGGKTTVSIDYAGTQIGEVTISEVSTVPQTLPYSTENYYDIQCTGSLGFSAIVKMKYDEGDVISLNENALRLYSWNGSEWTCPVPAGVDVRNGVVWCSVSDFSIYVIADTSMLDLDEDGISDYLELLYGLDPTVDDSQEDLDGDGVTNIIEIDDGTLPNNRHSDADELDDGQEKYGFYPYFTDYRIDKKFFNWRSETSIDISGFTSGEYQATLYGKAYVNQTTEEYLQEAIKMNMVDSDDISPLQITFNAGYEPLNDRFNQINITYSCDSFVIDENSRLLWLASNPSSFSNFSRFYVHLEYLHFEHRGSDPLTHDSNNNRLSDSFAANRGLSLRIPDTDNDRFWDSAEITYWMTVHGVSITEAIRRAKIADYDNDSLLDGEEIIFNTIPIDPDCDNDGLKDFEELHQYIPIKRVNLAGILTDVSKTFAIEEDGNYSIKITTRNTLENLVTATKYHPPANRIFASNEPDRAIAKYISNAVLQDSTIMTLSKEETSLTDVNRTGCAISSYDLDSGSIANITEARYNVIYVELEPGEYTINLNSLALDGIYIVSVKEQLIISKQGLDPFDPDVDDDNLYDGAELKIGSNPYKQDTDGDGLWDGKQWDAGNKTWRGEDVNNNGIVDPTETNPTTVDTDNDGLWDGFNLTTPERIGELSIGTLPYKWDTDGDELGDGYEIETEYVGGLKTDPLVWDTDLDTMPDGWEVTYNLNPTDVSDGILGAGDDGLTNAQEYTVGTNPEIDDSDDDTLLDGDEISGLTFRTSINEGAVSTVDYGSATTDDWLTLNHVTLEKYSYDDFVFNPSATFGYSSTILRNEKILELEDGSTIFAQWDGTTIQTGPEQLTYSLEESESIGGGRWLAQSFVMGYPCISSIKLNLTYDTAVIDSGTFSVEIRNDYNDLPGDIVYTSYSLELDSIDPPPAIEDGYEIDLNDIRLETDERYWIVLSTENVEPGVISLGADTGNPYTSGCLVYSPNSGARWYEIENKDLAFEVSGYAGFEFNTVYVWSSGADHGDSDENDILEGTVYIFDRITEPTTIDESPLPGYHNQELYIGSSPLLNDTDSDGLLDAEEIDRELDSDGDGLQNNCDPDSDNDGVNDGEEIRWNEDTDGDSLENMIDPDSDGDGVKDGDEPLWYKDIDNDGLEGMVDPDSDGDSLWDGVNPLDGLGEDMSCNGRVEAGETNPIDVDTDNDGVNDWVEQVELGWNQDADDDGLINAVDSDNDNDGVVDGNEVRVVFRTNATNGVYGPFIWVSAAISTTSTWDQLDYLNLQELEMFVWSEGGVNPAGNLLGEIRQGDLVRYDDPYIYVGENKFAPASNDDIVTSIMPVLSFAKKLQEVVVLIDTNEDGTPNIIQSDSDGDGVIDGLEDLNGNGIFDQDETHPYMVDTDGDGLDDGEEDKDFDGIKDLDETDPIDADTDDDGLSDSVETNTDTYVSITDTGTNPLAADTDGDGLWDGQEIGLTEDDILQDTDEDIFRADVNPSSTTYPLDPDSDDDGLYDGFRDMNGNGIWDSWEPGEDVNCNGDVDSGETNPNYANSDFDSDDTSGQNGLGDGYEWIIKTGILNPDSDKDEDGLLDWIEFLIGTDMTNPDTDGDGLLDKEEYDNPNLAPLDVDSDDDGLWDGPTTIYDGVTYLGEEAFGTNPCAADSDGDDLLDGIEVGLTTSSIRVYDSVKDYILILDASILEDPTNVPDLHAGILSTDSPIFQQGGDLDPSAVTDPTNPDTDGDNLPDGHIEGWNLWFDGVNLYKGYEWGTSSATYGVKYFTNTETKDPWEGEDLDLDGLKSLNETSPLLSDTDHDNLDDSNETSQNGRWYLFDSAVDEVDIDIFLAGDKYSIFIYASLEDSAVVNVDSGSVLSESIGLKTHEWTNTTCFDINPNTWVNIDIISELESIEKVLVWKIDTSIYNDRQYTFEEIGSVIPIGEIIIDIPEEFYVTYASMNISGSEYNGYYPSNVTVNVSDDADMEMRTKGNLTFEYEINNFADELNKYIIDKGSHSVPIMIYSATEGTIDLTNIELVFYPAVTCPVILDTDTDSLSDFDEKIVYYSNSLLLDSDLDNIQDVDELTEGTYPGSSDTDNDGLWDGFEDINGNGIFDMGLEVGEIIGTNPLDPDTDDDGLVDGAEYLPGTYWFEAEDYFVAGSLIVTDLTDDIGDSVSNLNGGQLIEVSNLQKDQSYRMFLRGKSSSGILYDSASDSDWDSGDSYQHPYGALYRDSDEIGSEYWELSLSSLSLTPGIQIEFDYRFTTTESMKNFTIWQYQEASGDTPLPSLIQSGKEIYSDYHGATYQDSSPPEWIGTDDSHIFVIGSNIWHHFKIVKIEDTFEIWIDNIKAYDEHNDAQIQSTGSFLFGAPHSTIEGSGYWDNLIIKSLTYLEVDIDGTVTNIPLSDEFLWIPGPLFDVEDPIPDIYISAGTGSTEAVLDRVMFVESSKAAMISSSEIIDSTDGSVQFQIDVPYDPTHPGYIKRAILSIGGDFMEPIEDYDPRMIPIGERIITIEEGQTETFDIKVLNFGRLPDNILVSTDFSVGSQVDILPLNYQNYDPLEEKVSQVVIDNTAPIGIHSLKIIVMSYDDPGSPPKQDHIEYLVEVYPAGGSPQIPSAIGPTVAEPHEWTWMSSQEVVSYSGHPTLDADMSFFGDTVHYVHADEGNNEVYYRRSEDGGRTWTQDQFLGIGEDPVIDVWDQTVHVVFVSSSTGVVYRRSVDGGNNWESEVPLNSRNIADETPDIAVEGNNIVVVWRDGAPHWHPNEYVTIKSDIYRVVSTDNGDTWTTPKGAYYDDPIDGYLKALNPCVELKLGKSYIVWEGYNSWWDPQYRIFELHSFDLDSWEWYEHWDDNTIKPENPYVAINDFGQVFIFWDDRISETGGGQRTIFCNLYRENDITTPPGIEPSNHYKWVVSPLLNFLTNPTVAFPKDPTGLESDTFTLFWEERDWITGLTSLKTLTGCFIFDTELQIISQEEFIPPSMKKYTDVMNNQYTLIDTEPTIIDVESSFGALHVAWVQKHATTTSIHHCANISLPYNYHNEVEVEVWIGEDLSRISLPVGDYFAGGVDPSSIPYIAGAINSYIGNHLDEPGFITDGVVTIPIEISSGHGTLEISYEIELWPYITDPLVADTDGDLLLDGEEINLRLLPLAQDSDGDGLLDSVEPVENLDTDPSDSNTDNDYFYDGSEVRVLFRTDAINSGDYLIYDGAWIAICPLNKLDDLAVMREEGEPPEYPVTLMVPDEFILSHLLKFIYDIEVVSKGDAVEVGFTDPNGLKLYYEQNDLDDIMDDILYVEIAAGSFAKFERDDSVPVVTTYCPVKEYAVAGQEVYQNTAKDDDIDGDGLLDGDDDYEMDWDYDDDGLSDGYEYYVTKTDHLNPDSDGDNVQDGTELGITWEGLFVAIWNLDGYYVVKGTDPNVFVPDADPSIKTNPRVADTDGDGLWDGWNPADNLGEEDLTENKDGVWWANGAIGEWREDDPETNPTDPDTDGDGLTDGYEKRTYYGDKKTNPRDADTDEDGLWDGYCTGIYRGERNFGGNPTTEHTDGDGILDSVEAGLTFDLILIGEVFRKGIIYVKYTDLSKGNFKEDEDPQTTTRLNNVDSDYDGIPDGMEDKNKDGEWIPTHPINWLTFCDIDNTDELDAANPDCDGDGLRDGAELILEYDSVNDLWRVKEIFADPLDIDSDDDGLFDGNSLIIDGKPYIGERLFGSSPTSTQSDDDNDDTNFDSDDIPDSVEAGLYYNGVGDKNVFLNIPADDPDDQIPDYIFATDISNFPSDADKGLTTTNPNRGDSDGDGIYDGIEDKNKDGEWDTDTIPIGDPIDWSEFFDVGNNIELNATNPDCDGDGLRDGYDELNEELDPLDLDTDDDGLLDGKTIKIGEVKYLGEASYGSHPKITDTDEDDLPDGLELGRYYAAAQRNILLDSDTGYSYILATNQGNFGNGDADHGDKTTNPTKADTDGDGIPDGVEDANKDGALPSNNDPALWTNTWLPGHTPETHPESYQSGNGVETDPNSDDTDQDRINDMAEIEANMNPLFGDTDGDGIGDGYEDWDFDGIVDWDPVMEKYTETDPTNPDSDGDGLGDAEEKMIHEGYIIGSGTTWANNPDCDGDTLSDGTEILGLGTDPLDDDTDRDGILDADEPRVVFRTNAEEASYGVGGVWIAIDDTGWDDEIWALKSYEYVGLGVNADNVIIEINDIGSTPEGYNISETGTGISIIVNQTLDYTLGTWHITEYMFVLGGSAVLSQAPVQSHAITNREVYGGLSPTSNDTDGDGLYDGWDVNAADSSDGKYHIGELTVGTEPLNPDTDGDSANDGQEAVFGYDLVWMEQASNGDIVSHDVHINPDFALALDVYNDWRNLDQDGISDWDENNPSVNYAWYTSSHNATEIENQFNAFMKENIPPMIEDVGIDTDTEWGWVGIFWLPIHSWAIVDVWITEVAPYDVTIKVLDTGASASFSGQPGTNWHHAVLNIDYVTDVLWKYTVNISATDTAGNYISVESEIEGIVAGFVGFFVDLVMGFLEAAWEAVSAAMSFLVDIIVGIIKGLISIPLAILNSTFSPTIENAWQSMSNTWETGEVNDVDVENSMNTLFGLKPLTDAFALLLVVISAIIGVVTAGVGTLIMAVIIPIIVSALFYGAQATGVIDIKASASTAAEGLTSWVYSLIGWDVPSNSKGGDAQIMSIGNADKFMFTVILIFMNIVCGLSATYVMKGSIGGAISFGTSLFFAVLAGFLAFRASTAELSNEESAASASWSVGAGVAAIFLQILGWGLFLASGPGTVAALGAALLTGIVMGITVSSVVSSLNTLSQLQNIEEV